MLSERSGLRARSEFIDRREIEKREGRRCDSADLRA
jgi:hypothetical protein